MIWNDDIGGEEKVWHPNGELAEQKHYNAGKKIGEWVSYNTEGRETNRVFYPDE